MATNENVPRIVVKANGLTLSTTITRADGSAATVYSNAARTSTVSFPTSVTSETTFYVNPGGYKVSTTCNGVEIAGPTGSPVTLAVREYQSAVVSPSVDYPLEAPSGGGASGTPRWQCMPGIGQPDAVVGTWGTQPLANIGSAFVFNSTHTLNDRCDFNSPPMQSGTYTLEVYVRQSSNKGITTVSIDDGAGNFTTIGTIDAYAAVSAEDFLTTFTGIALTSGSHTLRFQVTSKNASSSDYYCAIQAFNLRRTGA